MKTICLITPGHLASTPRLVKEADSLAAAGYRVHVVAGRHFAPADPLDDTLLASARWTCHRVDARHGLGVFGRKLLRRVARRLYGITPKVWTGLAARAQHAESKRLAQAATRVPAALYRGHCLGALLATVQAARRHRAAASFDLEDFHDAETVEMESNPTERTIVSRLQRTYLPACNHLTAAAPLIADEYRTKYGVTAETLLNVFPLAEAPTAPVNLPRPGPDRPACFYWFSQTVGPGRGLEQVISILARMRTPSVLHLRGFVTPAYREQLQQHTVNAGRALPLVFLPPAPPAEMARLAANADFGLSTETPPPRNRDLCLTNKIFTYLLAGIPQMLSPTRAQQALAPALGHAALLADFARPETTARLLDAWLAHPAEARRHAAELARSRYCWEVESTVLLASIQRLLRS